METKRLAIGLMAALCAMVLGACDSGSSRAYDAPKAATYSASYNMAGTVSEIDQDTGVLTLQGARTTAELPYSTAAMREIREGDKVTAHMALTKVSSVSERRAFDAPEMREKPPGALPPGEATLGRRDTNGTIEKIDHATGSVSIHSEAASFKLNFPTDSLSEFEEGDRVTLGVAFTRGS